MKLTFLGHASWLVQTETTTVASDLLLEDPFFGGAFAICPTRALDIEVLPRLDAIIISRRERDHFDPGTLLRLDRRTKVLCPHEPEILRVLARLEYRDVETFHDWSLHQIGDLDLVFTPSDSGVQENGFLVTDGSVLFWNQVNTVVNVRALERVRALMGTVDLVAHGYQPMAGTPVLEEKATSFPQSAYGAILQRAKLLAPRAVVPTANGYRTVGAQAWLDAYRFPVSRERFVQDVQRVLPSVETFIPNAGDVLQLEGERIAMDRQAAANDFVRTELDDTGAFTDFDPANEKPALQDENVLGWPGAKLHQEIRTIFQTRVPAGYEVLSRLHPLKVLGALIEVRVVYPDDAVESWLIDLSAEKPRVAEAFTSAWAAEAFANDVSDYVVTLAASALYEFALGRTLAEGIVGAGRIRMFSRPYRMTGGRLRELDDLAPPAIHGPPLTLPDFFTFLAYESDFALRRVDAEIDRLLGVNVTSADQFVWERAPLSVTAQAVAGDGAPRAAAWRSDGSYGDGAGTDRHGHAEETAPAQNHVESESDHDWR